MRFLAVMGEAAVSETISEPSENSLVLVVDDVENNRDLLCRRLARQGHSVLEADNGAEALRMLRKQSVDLVLLDLMMPVMDGYETLTAIKQDPHLQHIPVIVVTASSEPESAIRCIQNGAEDHISKPIDSVLLRARVNACLVKKRLHDQERRHQYEIEQHNLSLQDRVRAQVEEISSTQMAAIFAMSKLAESKDPETGEHLERMREYCLILCDELARLPRYRGIITPDYKANLYAASPLHDIGKVGIPDNVLLKPGKLDAAEWEIMRTHPLIGAATLRAVDAEFPGNAFIRTGIDIAECHHEKWDGSGYPHGFAGDRIPLAARVLALGDVYDALTSKRCYKDKFSHETARSIIVEQAGLHFDPEVVDAFLAREAEFVRIRTELHDADE